MVGLEQVGYREATILDIGCGVGPIHLSMLEQGASEAVGVDLAPAMLSEAKNWADDRGLGDRVDYVQGDFLTLDQHIDEADVSILDKVVCCYPDAQELVRKSLAKTKRAYGLTYPRDRWFMRLGIGFAACLFWLIRSDFRPYVHDPVQIQHWISGGGFEKRYEDQTAGWLTQVYVRV